MDDLVLLNPGPANTSERVRTALMRGDLCHREPEFARLLESIRTGLVESLHVAGGHEAIVLTGSGTAAVEMAVISSVRPGRAALVVNNGVYGDRMSQVCRVHGITAYQVAGEWSRPVEVDRVAAALVAHPDVDVVAMVMHETTTGLMNPVREVGALVRPTEAVLLLDAISATGTEAPDLPEIGADLICGTANKGLHGLPGASFVLVSRDKGIPRLREVPPRSVYLDANRYLAGDLSAQVPFTPAVPICYALDEAISEFREHGGYPARVAEYRARAALLRAGFDRLGLETMVAPADRSNSVTMLRLPAGVDYPDLHDDLKRRGYVVYAGQGELSRHYFRVCNMGHLSLETLNRFLGALADTLSVPR